MSKHLPVASRRVSRSAALGFVLLVAASLAASSFLGAAAAADPMERVERQVLADLAAGEGEATFWVHLREKADLRAAPGIRNRAERGRFVYRELTATAARGQAGLLALLRARGVDHEAFWITNTIRVTGDEELLRQIASRPEVEQITADRVYELPEPLSAAEEAQVNPVEWGIERINAPQVWSEFGARGEGIVVANIDSGVQFDHPALVRQYRGNAGGGNFDHDYNWFDPSNICASPSTVPCDNSGHGTHTMGTMVGDDGDPGPNQIGVAPHATWIAAKGCETNNCSFSAILAAGQWVLAPCRLDGSDCDPARRPHVVNNSWGGGSGDPFYRETVNAWVASGIFPAFASGNSGPSCSTAGSPGDYPESYSAGAFNIDGNIAGFSSRGASFYDGAIKPNIAAPGVDVRSSFPGDRYVSATGTSMASPHVAATVALMWSAAPALERDISRTEALLNQTAIDMSDLSCGGTAENNNVWGEGRLDAFAAVQASPRGPSGTLSGTVTDAGNGDPIGGATIHVRGPFDREAVTDANGRYSTRLPVGTYDLTASGFGYASETTNGVVISQGQTMAQDFALHAVASHTISGHVRDPRGGRVRNAIVRVLGTPIPPATTNAQGFYSFASVPEGTYTVSAQSRCHDVQSQQLLVAGDETLDFEPPIRQDGFGYSCQMTESQWLDADTELPLDKIRFDAGIMVDLPFPFPFYGKPYTRTDVNMNGLLCLSCDGAEGWAGGGWRFPRSAPFGSALIAPFWDSLALDREASVRTKLIGEAPSRGLVIEWRNMLFRGIDTTRRVDFETILFENGDIVFQYRNINSEAREQGIAAAVGLQNEGGTIAFQYSFHEPALADGLAVRFRVPLTATVAGTVTDANDVQPIQGATVRVLQDGTELRRAVTGSDGAFRLVHLPLGMYTLEAESDNYETRSIIVAFDHEDEVVTKNLSLRTARAEITPHALEFIVIPGHTKSKAVDLANTGSVPLTWDLRPVTGRVSVGPNGSEADRASLYPAISADGRYVAF